MRSNLNALGYKTTKEGRIVYTRKKPRFFNFLAIFRVCINFSEIWNESGIDARLRILSLITKKFDIRTVSDEVKEEAIKQVLIKKNLSVSALEAIDIWLKKWAIGRL
jgi:hypothetical protein